MKQKTRNKKDSIFTRQKNMIKKNYTSFMTTKSIHSQEHKFKRLFRTWFCIYILNFTAIA
jgi:hypothetical protein